MNRLVWTLPLAAACAVLTSACLDLSFPNPNSSARPPVITFISPQPAQQVPLSYFVSIDVQDAAGVNSVQLLCGSIVLNTWNTAPYQSQVDLHPCKAVAQANTDGGLATVTLLANATDALGHSATQQVNVRLDASAPGLTLQLPGRIPPGGTLQFGITSDRPLTGNPVAQVGGVDCSVAPVSAGNTQSFVATFSPVPEIGVDAFDGGGGADADFPLSVLSEVERPIGVSVDGTGTNDNVTHINAQVLISRIAWEAQIPGIVVFPAAPTGASTIQRAVGAPDGLYLPIQTDPSYQFVFPWTPGFFAAADGTFSPFGGSVLDLASNGFTPQGLNSAGQLLVTTDGGAGGVNLSVGLLNLNGQLVLDAGTIWISDSTLPLTQVGSLVCQEQWADAGFDFCSVPPWHQLACVGPTKSFLTPPFGNDVGHDSSTSAASLAASSGGNYVGIENYSTTPFCSVTETTWFVGGPSESLSMNLTYPGYANATAKLLPTGNGSFAIRVGSQTVHIAANGTWDNGVYFGFLRGAQSSGPLVPTGQLLAARPDDTVVRVFPDSPFTAFGAYPPDAGLPIALGRIPEPLAYPSHDEYLSVATVPEFAALPMDVVVSPSGAVSVLLSPTSPGAFQTFVVAHLDSNLQPRWVYQYPRTIFTGFAQFPQLVADPAADLIYFIDPQNQFVVALRP